MTKEKDLLLDLLNEKIDIEKSREKIFITFYTTDLSIKENKNDK